MDFEVQRCTRRCAASGRELRDGEEIYTVLLAAGGEIKRLDYALEAWGGPPTGAVGSWKSRIPAREGTRARQAPSDVLLELFQQLAARPEWADMRYVLTLLLVRRRVLRAEEPAEPDEAVMTFYCPRDDRTYRVPVAIPSESRVQEIQDELTRLLYADSPAG